MPSEQESGVLQRLRNVLAGDDLDRDREPIGDNAMPQEIHIPVDDVDTIRLEYQGEWYEVIKTDDGLKMEKEDA